MLVDADASEHSIILQSTTSAANSGLYDYLLPIFESETGIKVHVVTVGTGQAIRNARNGDGDVLLVHSKTAEEKFVADGFGVKRFDVMYNDFVIVGPHTDPAKISGLNNAKEALQKILSAQALFASRGDNSGTHKKEMQLWAAAQLDPSKDSGTWYRETGSGMGATLNVGVSMGAYVLTDRATWLSFGNKRDFNTHVQGDEAFFNQYGIILINPAKYPRVRAGAGQKFIDWMLRPTGQRAIARYKLQGKQLFFPNALPR
jgi:tungstate transport system substrate-binding protein